MPILGLAPSFDPTRPAHFDIERVIRPNILSLHPYRCARDDYSSGILLDANENALGHSIAQVEDTPPSTTTVQLNGDAHVDAELDRSFLSPDIHSYPDPSHPKVKRRIAEVRGLPSTNHTFLDVGSDGVIRPSHACLIRAGTRKDPHHPAYLQHVCTMRPSQ